MNIKSIAKKIAKGFGIFLLILIVLFAIIYFMYNKPLPEGEEGPQAQALVEKIKEAINQEAWDTTRYVEWTFRETNHYVWDKERHLVRAKWEAYEVFFNPSTGNAIIYKNGKRQAYDQSIIDKARFNFTNDAFWLNAPAQLDRENILHEVVILENGEEALLITYQTGGVTPGDSYLWILDENGLPKAWQMWVNILPIGGLEVSWEDWTTLSTGAKVATMHHAGPLGVPITNLKAYQDGNKRWKEDIFKELVEEGQADN